jgi:hypothetical protein
MREEASGKFKIGDRIYLAALGTNAPGTIIDGPIEKSNPLVAAWTFWLVQYDSRVNGGKPIEQAEDFLTLIPD